MPQRHLLMVFANPGDGREDEFNEFYETHHVHEVLNSLPEFKAIRRFKLSPHQRSDTPPPSHQYVTVCEIETDDVEAHHRAFAALLSDPDTMPFTLPPDGVVKDDFVGWVWTPVGTPVTRS